MIQLYINIDFQVSNVVMKDINTYKNTLCICWGREWNNVLIVFIT